MGHEDERTVGQLYEQLQYGLEHNARVRAVITGFDQPVEVLAANTKVGTFEFQTGKDRAVVIRHSALIGLIVDRNE
jgi:hypothetical protein